MPGLVRDRYEVLAVVGRGGQGEVLHALDRMHDRAVALKVREARDDPDALLTEARALFDLRPHPGVTLVREDFFLDDGRYVLVMDWIDGRDLAAVLAEDGPLRYERACEVLSQVASALDHLHRHEPPLVHQDVKPANIVLDAQGQAVLVDFGVAQSRGDPHYAATPAYRAPELALGKVTPAADVYALAVTAHELLTGRLPGLAEPDWTGVPHEARERVRETLAAGLAVDPARRPASAARLVAGLAPPSVPETVVVLSVDLGDTEDASSLDTSRELVASAAASHGGEVATAEGPQISVVVPNAAAALETSRQVQLDVAAAPVPEGVQPRPSIGIHAGEARRVADQWIGLDIQHTSELARAAWRGQVVVSEACRSLVVDRLPAGMDLRDLGEHRLRDLGRAERLYQLLAPDLPEEFAPLSTLAARPNNLPVQLTRFVGRDQERRDLVKLLHDEPLVTLTGLGGIGKTRLALRLAADALDRYPDGVWFVDLSGRSDPEGVVNEVAAMLGVRPPGSSSEGIRRRLLDYLAARELLLVLDNCEHVLDAAADLAESATGACPQLTVLATSRQALGIAGEAVCAVPPLDEDGVDLFVDRARAVSPSLSVSADTLPLIARICEQLEGIPLAIELAAARLRVLDVHQLEARLADRFRLLARGRSAQRRQQTLEATIDWSYELLSPEERTLFERLSVFAGGFTIDAVEDVCTGGLVRAEDALDLLTDLVDKSLVSPQETTLGTSRCRLLETLREYAHRRLVAQGAAQVDEVRRRHYDHYSRMFQGGGQGALGGAPQELMDPLGTERDNLQAALDWTLARGDGAGAAFLTEKLATYWGQTWHLGHAVRILSETLSRSDLLAPAREAGLRTLLASILIISDDQERGLGEAHRATELVADEEPSSLKTSILTVYAHALGLSVRTDPSDAVAAARAAVATAEAVGELPGQCMARQWLGNNLAKAGDVDGAVGELREALAIGKELGAGAGDTYPELLEALFFARRVDEAQEVVEEVLPLWVKEPPGSYGYMRIAGYLGYLNLQSGDWELLDSALSQVDTAELEGIVRAWVLHLRGSLRWMQGRLDDARSDVEEWRAHGVLPRNFHEFFSLSADVAADDGRLDDAHALASEYLAVEVHPAREATKICVFGPLVRAEVKAALAASGAERKDHEARAREAFASMNDLLTRFPPAAGWYVYETPESYLRFAEAELSRLGEAGPDPDLWQKAMDSAFMAYWKNYARDNLRQ